MIIIDLIVLSMILINDRLINLKLFITIVFNFIEGITFSGK